MTTLPTVLARKSRPIGRDFRAKSGRDGGL